MNFITALLISSLTLSAWANERPVQKKQFSLSVPESWSDNENLFGLPFVFLGPKLLSKRPSLSVVPSETKAIELTGELGKTGAEVYNLRRQEWVEQHQGKVVKFFPYEKSQNPVLGELHHFSFQYTLGSEVFEEHSLYFFCQKSLMNVKSLALVSDTKGKLELDKIIKSIRCK